MSRMIRKQIYLEAAQDALLKRLAAARQVSEATIIRESVAQYAASLRRTPLDRAAWERQQKRIARSIAKGPLPGHRTWRRDDLYADRLDRLDR